MPPRRRGRPAGTTKTAPAQTEAEAEVITDNEDNNSDSHGEGGDTPDGTDEEDQQYEQVRFFNSTFTTFRVSPLYVGQQPLTPAGLELLSRRLRDTLVGDVVRGVQIALESDSASSLLGNAGALERVEWRERDIAHILPTSRLAEEKKKKKTTTKRGAAAAAKISRQQQDSKRFLQLELEYESISFSALLLPRLEDDEDGKDGGESQTAAAPPAWAGIRNRIGDSSSSPEIEQATEDSSSSSSSFAHFPLLLVRMPAPLRAVLVDFLSSTFDCRISPLHLGTRTLVRSWEHWIANSGAAAGGSAALKKDLGLTLGFHLEPTASSGTKPPSSSSTDDVILDPKNNPSNTPRAEATSVPAIQLGLKTMDVVVPAEEVRRFLRVDIDAAAKATESRKQKKRSREEQPLSDPARARARARRRKLAGGKDEEGWAWRDDDDGEKDIFSSSSSSSQPFTEALALYLDHHLALDIFHPGVRVLRVMCDAFALADGRVKIFAPSTVTSRGQRRAEDKNDEDGAGAGGGGGGGQQDVAIEAFVRNLVRRAQGNEWSHSALQLANLVASER